MACFFLLRVQNPAQSADDLLIIRVEVILFLLRLLQVHQRTIDVIGAGEGYIVFFQPLRENQRQSQCLCLPQYHALALIAGFQIERIQPVEIRIGI